MTKDNVTGKNKDFYDLGKKIFDRLNPQGAINLEMPKARTGDCLLTKVCAAEGHAIQKQHEWVGLTEDEIEGAIDDGFAFGLDDGNVSNKTVIRYARAIEAKLREKNG
jgi:hypothetical protein